MRSKSQTKTINRRIGTCIVVFFLVFILFISIVLADTGPNIELTGVSSGNFTSSYDATTNTINQTATNNTIANFRKYDIAANETVILDQFSPSNRALFRVSGDGSVWEGAFTSNGIFYFQNDAGIMFGNGARINVNQLIATSLHMSDADFLAGNNNFAGGYGSVINLGDISAEKLALIGKQVANYGNISCPAGFAVMAVGDQVYLGRVGSQVMVEVAATPPLPDAEPIESPGVLNEGTVDVGGGMIIMAAAGDIYSQAVSNVGVLSASVNSGSAGQIKLTAPEGTVVNSGTIEAKSASGEGGTVQVLGDKVGLFGSSNIDVSGSTDGGTVLVGGDYQGKGDTPTASVTYVSPDATIKADATDNGDGGKVIVWSDNVTRFYGDISARGGANGGNGGLVEVSGRGNLGFYGYVDTSAPQGDTGTLLLDPTNLNIINGGGGSLDGSLPDVLSGEGAASESVSETALEGLGAVAIILEATEGVTLEDLADGLLDLADSSSLTINANNDLLTSGNFTFDDTTNTISVGGAISIYGANVTVGNLTSSSGGVTLGIVKSDGAGSITVSGNINTGSGGLTINNNVEASNASTFSNTGSITTSGGSGSIDIQTQGAVSIGGNWVLGTGNVTVDGAGNGVASITNTGGTIQMGSGDLELQATGAVGSSGTPIATTGLTDVAAKSGTGGVFISNSGSGNINITTVDGTAGVTTTTSGNISITNSAGNIVTAQPVTAAGAGSTVTLNATQASATITIGGAGDIDSVSGLISLLADGDVTLNTGGTVGAATTAGITITADQDGSGAGTFTADAAIGNALVAGDITITADDVILQSNTTITGTGNLFLLPSQAATTIGIAGGDGHFGLSAAEISYLIDGFSLITIGRAADGTGEIDIHDITFTDDVTFYGGAMGLETLTDTGNTVTLDSVGAITNVDGVGTTINVVASKLLISDATSVGLSEDALNTTIANLELSNIDGATYILESDGLIIDAANTDGYLSVQTTAGNITATNVDTSDDDVLLTSAGNIIVVDLDVDGATVTLDADGTITAPGDVAGVKAGTLTITDATSVGTGTGDDAGFNTNIDILNMSNVTGASYIIEDSGITLGAVNVDGLVNVQAKLGDIAATSVVTSNDDVTLTSTAGAITVGSINAGAGTATLTAFTTINDASVDEATDITAASINLDAVDGIGATQKLELSGTTIDADTTGAGAASIILSNDTDTAATLTDFTTVGDEAVITFSQTGGGSLTVTSATTSDGDVTISVDNGDLTATLITVLDDGNVYLTTTNSGDIKLGVVTAAADDVTLTAAGAITDENAGTNNITADVLHILGATTVGTASDYVDTTITTLEMSGVSGASYILEADTIVLNPVNVDGPVTIATTLGPITATSVYTSDDDVTLTAKTNIIVGIIDVDSGTVGDGGKVTLTAQGGTILDDEAADDTTIDIIAGNIVLNATAGIGDATYGALDTQVTGSTIEAHTTGDAAHIDIDNTSTADVDSLIASTTGVNANITFDQDGGGDLTVTSATTVDGNIDISADSGDMTVILITAGDDGDVSLDTTTNGDILLGVVMAEGDLITINSINAIDDDGVASGEDYVIDLTADTLNLDAVTGIGTTNAIETSAANIDADTSGGGPAHIDLNNYLDDDTTLNASTAGANANITFDQFGIEGTTGTLTLESVVTISGNIDISSEAGVIHGTAQLGAPTTITLAAGASGTDDFYNGRVIEILDGMGGGQIRTVSDYDGTTKIATVSVAWTTTPDATSEYGIIDSGDIIAEEVTAGGAGNVSIDTTIAGDVTVGTSVGTTDGYIKINSAGAVTNNGTIATSTGNDNYIEITAADEVTNNSMIQTVGGDSYIEITATDGLTNAAGATIATSGDDSYIEITTADVVTNATGATIGTEGDDSYIEITATDNVTNAAGATIGTEGDDSWIAITTDGTVTNDSTIITIGAEDSDITIAAGEGADDDVRIGVAANGTVQSDYGDITIVAGGDLLIGNAGNVEGYITTAEEDGTGDIKITVEGDVLMADTDDDDSKITSGGYIHIDPVDVTIDGAGLEAVDNIEILATGAVTNNSTITTTGDDGYIEITAADEVTNSAGASISTIGADSYIEITATDGLFNNAAATIETSGADSYIKITSADVVTNAAGATIIGTEGDGSWIEITATGDVTNATGATIETYGDDSWIAITTDGSVTNDSTIITYGAEDSDIEITAGEGADDDVEIGVAANGTVQSDYGDITIVAGGDLLIGNAGNNVEGYITTAEEDGTGDIKITVEGDVLIAATTEGEGSGDSKINAGGWLDIDPVDVTINDDGLEADEYITITATGTVTNNTTVVTTDVDSYVEIEAGSIVQAGDITTPVGGDEYVKLMIADGLSGENGTITDDTSGTTNVTTTTLRMKAASGIGVASENGRFDTDVDYLAAKTANGDIIVTEWGEDSKADVELQYIIATHGSIVLECVNGGMTQTSEETDIDGTTNVITAGGSTLTMIQAESIDLSIFTFGNQANTHLMLSSTGTASGDGLDSGEGAVTAVDWDHRYMYRNGAEVDGDYTDGRNYAGGKTANAADQWKSIQAKATRNIVLQGSTFDDDVRDIVIGTHIGGNPFDAAHTFGDGTLLVGDDTLLDGGRYVISGTAQAGTLTTITLAAGASSTDNFYNGRVIEILDGTGEGQIGTISAYNGTTKVATVAWDTAPDGTSEYGINAIGVLTSTGGGVSVVKSTDGTIRTFGYDTLDYVTISGYSDTTSINTLLHTGVLLPHIDDYAIAGRAQAGASTTITLAADASGTDDFYNGRQIKILDGTGKGQVRTIIDYDGTTKVATLSAAWTTKPNSTSDYGIDEYAGRAAIVLVSETEDLKLGLEDLDLDLPNIKLNANGTYAAYGSGTVDDRAAINFLDNQLLEDNGKFPGEPIDVAIYISSYQPGYATGLYNPISQTGQDVVMNASVETLANNAAMVIDAYDTVKFGSAFEDSPAFDTGTGKVLEACSRITETVQDAWILGTLPHVDEYADGLLPDWFNGSGYEYILRGGEDNAWVLQFINPVPVPPIMICMPEDHNDVEEDCNDLWLWTAKELGIENTQVYVEDTLAQSTDATHRQLCEMCEALNELAKILSDPNGTRVSALNEVVNEIAPASSSKKLTYEQMVSVVSVLSEHANDGTRYAVAREWFGAMTAYVNILNKEFGWSRDKAIEFAMRKYASEMMASNPRTATIVWMYLERN